MEDATKITIAVAGLFTVTLTSINPWLVFEVVGLLCITVIAVKGMQPSGNEKNS